MCKPSNHEILVSVSSVVYLAYRLNQLDVWGLQKKTYYAIIIISHAQNCSMFDAFDPKSKHILFM